MEEQIGITRFSPFDDDNAQFNWESLGRATQPASLMNLNIWDFERANRYKGLLVYGHWHQTPDEGKSAAQLQEKIAKVIQRPGVHALSDIRR
jgi:hypothetical protein